MARNFSSDSHEGNLLKAVLVSCIVMITGSSALFAENILVFDTILQCTTGEL